MGKSIDESHTTTTIIVKGWRNLANSAFSPPSCPIIQIHIHSSRILQIYLALIPTHFSITNCHCFYYQPVRDCLICFSTDSQPSMLTNVKGESILSFFVQIFSLLVCYHNAWRTASLRKWPDLVLQNDLWLAFCICSYLKSSIMLFRSVPLYYQAESSHVSCNYTALLANYVTLQNSDESCVT